MLSTKEGSPTTHMHAKIRYLVKLKIQSKLSFKNAKATDQFANEKSGPKLTLNGFDPQSFPTSSPFK